MGSKLTDVCFREELIARVAELITAERKRLERQRYEEERLAKGDSATATNGHTPTQTGSNGDGNGVTEENGDESVTDKTQVPTGPMPEIERGLCVVCQDEEATLAVVDCGYVTFSSSMHLDVTLFHGVTIGSVKSS